MFCKKLKHKLKELEERIDKLEKYIPKPDYTEIAEAFTKELTKKGLDMSKYQD